MNDLLGAKEPAENEILAKLPKLKRESPDAHLRTFHWTSPEATVSVAGS